LPSRALSQTDLRRKSFEVLRYLVEHTGRVVTKEELIKAVWPNVTIGDESLTQCVSEVRRALGEQSYRIIKTVPRRGYLFNVPISQSDATAAHTTLDRVAHPRVDRIERLRRHRLEPVRQTERCRHRRWQQSVQFHWASERQRHWIVLLGRHIALQGCNLA
jgi:DNA-binding winged helix-turn-helix (wHTH) protein